MSRAAAGGQQPAVFCMYEVLTLGLQTGDEEIRRTIGHNARSVRRGGLPCRPPTTTGSGRYTNPESQERFVHRPDSGWMRRFAAPAERQDHHVSHLVWASWFPKLLFKTAADRPANRDVCSSLRARPMWKPRYQGTGSARLQQLRQQIVRVADDAAPGQSIALSFVGIVISTRLPDRPL